MTTLLSIRLQQIEYFLGIAHCTHQTSNSQMATTDQSYFNDKLNSDPHAFGVLVDLIKDLVYTLAFEIVKNRK